MCNCRARRTAIVGAVKKPSTALTAAQFVAKTGAQDVAKVATNTTQRVMSYLQRRGMRS